MHKNNINNPFSLLLPHFYFDEKYRKPYKVLGTSFCLSKNFKLRMHPCAFQSSWVAYIKFILHFTLVIESNEQDCLKIEETEKL